MTRGKIAVLIPAVYDKLDKEFVSGIYLTLKDNNFDTLVFTSVSADSTDSYMCGENNIYNLPFLSDVDGIIMASNRFHDENLKEAIYRQLEGEGFDELSQKICKSLSELGIYITQSEINVAKGKITDLKTAEEQLLQLYNTLTDKTPVKNSEAYSDIFSQLRKEMKYSPQNNWSVSVGAEKTGLSGSHFQRLYKKHFGVSFNEELITFRIDRAKYLLKNTSMTVSQIAEECGYTNSAHFMRQFKERENTSAGQYRKTLR